MLLVLGLLLSPLLLPAQAPRIGKDKVHGREGWAMDNGLVRVVALRGGGHLAEVRLVSSDPRAALNPMRVPHFPTIDPHTYDPARHDAVYGNGASRWLMSGYMGHLLCFPFYGPPSSEAEVAAQLGSHGEAPIVEWKEVGILTGPTSVSLRYGADLTRTQYRVERIVTLEKGKRHVRVEEWVENLASYDRPFQWMQHATFGPPFVEAGKNFLDASVTKSHTREKGPGVWSDTMRAFTSTPKTGGYTALRHDPARRQQFFTLYHSAYPVLIGYVYPSEGFAWLADWQENLRASQPPWNNKVVARGLEFGNSPYDEGLRKAVERGSLYGAPAYGWIGARQRLKTEFTIFVQEIPAGFKGVRDVAMVSGEVKVTPR